MDQESDLDGTAFFELADIADGLGFVLAGDAIVKGVGFSVASAGDVNDDGFADIIIGSTGLVGSSDSNTYVVFGTNAGFPASLDLTSFDGANGFVIEGSDVASVAHAGDVNNDGIDDLILGAPSEAPNGAQSGAVYIVYGSGAGFAANFDLSTLNGVNGFAIDGLALGDLTGFSVSTAGDVNDDGIDDFLFGAPSGTDGGKSYVVFGTGSGFPASFDLSSLDGTNGFVLNPVSQSDRVGWSTGSAGDVNGDGIPDVIIGAYRAGVAGDEPGAAYVVFGADTGFAASIDLSGLNGTNGFIISGLNNQDQLGWSVASAGDINGDGVGDIILGAPGADPNGLASGVSYVIFGSNAGFSANFDLSSLDGSNGFILNGFFTNDEAGVSVASAGDINGDGFGDILIGAEGATVFSRPTEENNFSLQVGGSKSNAGKAYVVFGSNAGFDAVIDLDSVDGTNGFVLDGVRPSDFSGNSVAAAGDVNGDGVDDLIIGAWRADPEGIASAGEAYILFGSAGLNLEIIGTVGSDPITLGNDSIDGTSGNNRIFGLTGSDTVNGLAGDDLLVGDRSADELSGGDGADTLLGGGGADLLTGADGDDSILGDIGFDQLQGGVGNDTLDGGGGKDTIFGGDGLDLISGGRDDDQLFGGDGDDTLDGGKRNDVMINGESGNDLLFGGTGMDTLLGELDDDTIDGGGANDVAMGGLGNDSIIGWFGADSLIGGDGDDTIEGNNGQDTIIGGAGADILRGGAAEDSLTGNDGNDTLEGGNRDDTLRGQNDNDLLSGGNNDDQLFGGNGNDTLIGGDGNDTLAGNGGDDRFIFTLGDDADVINGFVAGSATDDVIDLSGMGPSFDTFAEVMAVSSQSGANTVINFGGGDMITLSNVLVADLNQDDFLFT